MKTMSKTTRKVTVDTSRRTSTEAATSSVDFSSKTKKKSVFDRLGTAGAASHEPDLCRTFLREGDCPYGNKCKYSHNIGAEMKKYKKERHHESDDGGYQEAGRSPEHKRDKRKVQDGERLKIEFKKDPILKKKQTISELYEEEVPMRKMKKERERKEKELLAHSKSKMAEEIKVVTKDEHVRNIQLKGEEKKERKAKAEVREDEDSHSDTQTSRKHKKKRRHEESEEERIEAAPKKKKKRKDKPKLESSSTESESDREKKKKSKKDKYKSYESEDSGNNGARKKMKSYEYEEAEDRRIVTDSKKKKKKKKEKFESGSEDFSDKETYHSKKDKGMKGERGHEAEKLKKGRKIAEEDDSPKQRKTGEGKKQKHSPGLRKESQKGKEKIKTTASFSSLSSGSSLGEEDEEEDHVDYQRKSKKVREQEREYHGEKKSKERRRREKHHEDRTTHLQEDARDLIFDERRKEPPQDSYSRDHYSQHQESRYEHWERDRANIEQANQYGSPYYGRSRGPEPYRGRYEPPAKGSTERDRPGFRQYQEGGYGSDQARYRDRGNRESYPYTTNRRSGHPGEDDGYTAGRSRDPYTGGQEPLQGYAREEKQGQRHREYSGMEYSAVKIDQDDFDERGRRKSGAHRGSHERKDYEAKSPKRRSRSPKERDGSKDRLKSKKRRREEESPVEKDQSVERKSKKAKGDVRSESDADSGAEADVKSEKGRKNFDFEKRDAGRRSHRDSENQQKRDEFVDEKRDRKTEGRSRDREKERGTERDRDRRGKVSSTDRSKNGKSRSEKRAETPLNEENRADKVEDKRLTALKTSSQRHSSPTRKSDSESGSKSQRKRGRSGQDGQDVNLDDVYEKISDDELDFFDEESAKVNKPASLEDLDWSALAAIQPPSKKEISDEAESHRSKHSSFNILKNIGFSPNLLRGSTLMKIQQKFKEIGDKNDEKEDGSVSIDFENGTAALIANKMNCRRNRKNLIANLANQGTVLSMRKDINVRKELRVPPNRLAMNHNLYCNAPSSPADKELFLASATLYKKITPGEAETSCKIIPSLVGSVIECAN